MFLYYSVRPVLYYVAQLSLSRVSTLSSLPLYVSRERIGNECDWKFLAQINRLS